MLNIDLVLIDTNIFLELFLNQNNAIDCEELLQRIWEGKQRAVVTHFSVHAVEAILKNGEPLVMFARNIENSAGMRVYETTIEDEIAIAILSDKIGMDFDDALQYYVAKKIGVGAIVSFDRHFDKLNIPRIEPSKLIK